MVKNPPANAGGLGNMGSVLGLGRSLEKDMAPNSIFLLGNPMDRGAWPAIVHGVTKELDMTTTEQQN